MAAFNRYQAEFGLGTDDGGKYDRMEKEKSSKQDMNAEKDTKKDVEAAKAGDPIARERLTKRKVPNKETPVVRDPVTSYPQDIRYEKQNRIFVGDEIVTEFDGYLIPGVQNLIGVQWARQTAKRLGLPDPLADIPVRPGTPAPRPLP
jgi:hypothetical protein